MTTLTIKLSEQALVDLQKFSDETQIGVELLAGLCAHTGMKLMRSRPNCRAVLAKFVAAEREKRN